MASVIEHEEYVEDSGESEEAKSRITPVMPPPDWLRELGDGVPTLTPPIPATEEDVFWNTPPRYSLLVSLAPPPLVQARSRWQVWSARLLFATISCAVVTLLLLELKSGNARVPNAFLRETGLATNAP